MHFRLLFSLRRAALRLGFMRCTALLRRAFMRRATLRRASMRRAAIGTSHAPRTSAASGLSDTIAKSAHMQSGSRAFN